LEQALAVEPQWEAHRADLAFLTDFGVMYRYPGDSADRQAAMDACRHCRAFRKAARAAFSLSP